MIKNKANKNNSDDESLFVSDGENDPDSSPNGNNNEIAELTALVKLSLENQKELSERLEEYEEKSRHNSDFGAAQLKMVNITYDTPDRQLIELSNISPQAPRMLANEITLENIFNPNVLSGKIPLTRIYRESLLRANRSVNGIQLMRAAGLAKEQIQAVNESDDMEKFNLGAQD